MNTYSNKAQENKSQSMVNTVSQRQKSGEATFQFVDNRYEAIVQRNLQEMANNSPQAKQAAKLQTMANNYPTQHQNPIQKKENNTGLPDNLKSGIENLSGYSMDDVKVHYNSDKPSQLQAHAYAQGTDIHIAPGQEEHLPHEVWHVVQQKQGRVKPTMQMKGGVNINDDTGLEQEADVKGLMAMNATEQANPSLKQLQPIKTNTFQLVRKSLVEDWEKIKTRQSNENGTSFIAQIEPMIKAFDLVPRLSAKAQVIDEMQEILEERSGKLSVFNFLSDYNTLIRKTEKLLTETKKLLNNTPAIFGSASRLDEYTADDEAPYKQMTDEGMLWNMPELPYNTHKIGKSGKKYFEDLSARNIKSMNSEIIKNKHTEKIWFTPFIERASHVLSNAVVNHYTTSNRAELMLREEMKSKMILERDLPNFKHNTSSFDDIGLANSGFLFFFIESPNASLRNTRFAQGDSGGEPARISIPIKESGLLEKGWLMLSDFAQLEYPEIMTKEDDSKHTSWLRTRSEKADKKREFKKPVRHFSQGIGNLNEAQMIQNNKSMNLDERQAYSVVDALVSGDSKSKQVYGDPNGKGDNKPLKIHERLLNNILVGKDIIPGLAQRAALEVARISYKNPSLGDKLSSLKGEALMQFILKDLFRPQAMIPNQMKIKEQYVELVSDKANLEKISLLTSEIIDLGKQVEKSQSGTLKVIEKKMTEFQNAGRFKHDEQIVKMSHLRKHLLEQSKRIYPNKEVIKGHVYVGSLQDLESAIVEIAQDNGADLYQLEILGVFRKGVPFESKSTLISAFESILDGKKKVAVKIADYLVENTA
ncbi:protein of unknown function [Sphingobacterium nematocida]|uniref:eCIS core domain-containing protein n=1 Tax=Sphingobacterium nematocida TaxID=1513896 RepID=A0A1T5GID6_9SPHI|nr:DUF4157 domain-containing protein [Sphingobacterium nematocida]SKC08214.1 protein of unknown function [Sphingobacterium nematocida]